MAIISWDNGVGGQNVGIGEVFNAKCPIGMVVLPVIFSVMPGYSYYISKSEVGNGVVGLASWLEMY